MPMKLYLASKSPRRQELLQMITPEFTVISSDFDESTVPENKPEEYVKTLAYGKAADTDPQYAQNGVVIGCDTIVVSPQGKIFGKPKDAADAAEMLRTLSGTTHSVITGVCLYTAQKQHSFSVTSLVTFYPLSEQEIEEYLACGEFADKAGAYGIQGKGGLLCEKINGDYFNIVGLPVAALSRALKAFSTAK